MEVVSPAIALVVPYLVGAGGAATDQGLRRLWSSLTDSAERGGDAAARLALRRLGENPADPTAQTAAAAALQPLVASNPQFLAALSGMVKDLRPQETTVTQTTTLSGDARIGKQINIGSAGDVTIE